MVSICLPNLNKFPYLNDRHESICAQTYRHWEVIVVDGYSEDGSWQFFQNLAQGDTRFQIAQAPRGLYSSWNDAIRRARGKYIYIATSDDTMAPDCLEALVDALEEHSECDLAHCNLKVIDESGAPVSGIEWPGCTSFALDDPTLIHRKHIRNAPYDGLLHLIGSMVYMSVAQLLIRRSLFSRIGYFDTRWGTMGDRNWEMKAGLVSNTVHVPDTWASWRIYKQQASAGVDVFTMEHFLRIEDMISNALTACASSIPAEILHTLQSDWKPRSAKMRKYYSSLNIRKNGADRRMFQLGQMLSGGSAVWYELTALTLGKPKWVSRAAGEIREWLVSAGLEPIVEVSTNS